MTLEWLQYILGLVTPPVAATAPAGKPASGRNVTALAKAAAGKPAAAGRPAAVAATARPAADLSAETWRAMAEVLEAAKAQGPVPWLVKALSYLGVHRAFDHQARQIMAWAAELGGEIARDYTSDVVPWCALFANAVLMETGFQGTGTLWALDFAHWGVPLAGPEVGSFAPMKRFDRSGKLIGGHVAIVVGRDQHGNLMCVGGNQSSRVSIEPFPKDRPVSFRFPADSLARPVRPSFDTLPLVKSDGRISTQEA